MAAGEELLLLDLSSSLFYGLEILEFEPSYGFPEGAEALVGTAVALRIETSRQLRCVVSRRNTGSGFYGVSPSQTLALVGERGADGADECWVVRARTWALEAPALLLEYLRFSGAERRLISATFLDSSDDELAEVFEPPGTRRPLRGFRSSLMRRKVAIYRSEDLEVALRMLSGCRGPMQEESLLEELDTPEVSQDLEERFRLRLEERLRLRLEVVEGPPSPPRRERRTRVRTRVPGLGRSARGLPRSVSFVGWARRTFQDRARTGLVESEIRVRLERALSWLGTDDWHVADDLVRSDPGYLRWEALLGPSGWTDYWICVAVKGQSRRVP